MGRRVARSGEQPFGTEMRPQLEVSWNLVDFIYGRVRDEDEQQQIGPILKIGPICSYSSPYRTRPLIKSTKFQPTSN